MSRRLILTADDLGREAASVAPILDLVTSGPLTATTIIPVAPDSRAAAAAARRAGVQPRLHVTLTSEAGMSPWHPLCRDVPSLVDARGRLYVDPVALGAVGEEADVAAELSAQWDWMAEQGLDPTGLDSHAGTLYGLHGRSWLVLALQFCAAHGLAFRLPRDPTPYLGADEMGAELAEQHALAVALADRLWVRLPEVIVTNRRSAAELGGYAALREHYLRLLGALPEGTSEIFCHPAPEGAAAGPDAVLRAWELRLLGDPVFARALEVEGLELVDTW